MIKSAVSLGKNSFQKKPGLTRELIDAVLVRSLKFLACTTKILLLSGIDKTNHEVAEANRWTMVSF